MSDRQSVQEALAQIRAGQGPDPERPPVSEALARLRGGSAPRRGVAGFAPVGASRAEVDAAHAERMRTIRGFDANFAQGTFLPGFADETRAAIRNPLSFAQHLIPGGKSGDEYVQARDEERATVAQYRNDRPVGAVAANVAGGIATARYLPAMAAGAKAAVSRIPGVGATVARAIPAFQTGAAAPVTLGKLAHEGAALGAIAGAGEAKEMRDVPISAGIGSAAGVVGGAVTRGVMGIGSYALDKAGLRGKFAETLNGLAGRMGQAKPKGTPEEVAEAVRGVQYRTTAGGSPSAGPGAGVLSTLDDRAREMLLVDAERAGLTVDDIEEAASVAQAAGKPFTLQEILGQAGRRRARSVRAINSEGGHLVDEVNEFRVADRKGGMLPRVRRDIADHFRVNPNEPTLTPRQQATARSEKADPLYREAFETHSGPIDDPRVGGLVAELSDLVPAARKEVDDYVALRIKHGKATREDFFAPVERGEGEVEEVPTLRYLDLLKQRVDDEINFNRDPTAPKRFGTKWEGDINAARAELLDVLDNGLGLEKYTAARGQFAGDSEVIQALKEGAEDFASPDRTAAQMAAKMDGLSEAGRDAYRRSVFNAAHERPGSVGRGRDVTQPLAIPNTEDKLRVVLGEADATGLRADMDMEGEIFATRRFTNQGSQTYDKALDNEDFTEQAIGVGADAVRGNWLDVLKKVAVGRGSALGQGVNRQTADALAPMLTAGGRGNSDELAAVIKALREAQRRVAERRASKETARRAVSGTVGRIGGSGD